jgi:hypothetical protein
VRYDERVPAIPSVPPHAAALLAAAVLLAAGCPATSTPSSRHSGLPPEPPAAVEPGSFRPPVYAPMGRLYLTLADELSESFVLVQAAVALDGNFLLYCPRPEDPQRSLDMTQNFLAFDGPLTAGPHALSIALLYRGHGQGIFSYLSGYTFRVESTHEFALAESSLVVLRAAARERGGPETALEDRPFIVFEDRSAEPVSAGSYRECPWVDSPAEPGNAPP